MVDIRTARDYSVLPWGGKTLAEAQEDYKHFVLTEAIRAGEVIPVDGPRAALPGPETTRKAQEYDALIASGALAALGINP